MPGGMDLKQEVLNASTCTLCGACLDWCPYLKNIEDHLVLTFDCNVSHGRCYSICPRTFTDWQAIREQYLADTPQNLEIGPYFKVYKVKAKHSVAGQQDGGTVTYLLKKALEEDELLTVLLTSSDDRVTPYPVLTNEVSSIEKAAGSKFLAAPSFRKIVEANQAKVEKLAVVGRPCQIQALRKMDYNSPPDKPKLDVISIGLFCMWSLNWDFRDYVYEQVNNEEILSIAIPQEGLKVTTKTQVKNLPFEEVRKYIRSGCKYCFDMTSELADISVGSFEISPGWNTVIIRTKTGQELFDKAVGAGYLISEEYPAEELKRLKGASLGKKVRALNAIKEGASNGLKPFIDLENGEYQEIMTSLPEGVNQ
ncbi:MAG: hypothetical protein GX790_01940 [Syntrophomonadaceae bacterium]|nr:hypothetical protein [Syntrophomonadaceae bacterium]